MQAWLLIAVVLALAILVARSERVRQWFIADPEPSRIVTAASAAMLAGLGFLFEEVLVVDSGDNAYLAVALVGIWLIAMSVPFALATLLPRGAVRRAVVLFAVMFLLIVGALSALGLFVTVLATTDEERALFLSHLVGLLTLLPALAALWAGYRFLGSH